MWNPFRRRSEARAALREQEALRAEKYRGEAAVLANWLSTSAASNSDTNRGTAHVNPSKIGISMKTMRVLIVENLSERGIKDFTLTYEVTDMTQASFHLRVHPAFQPQE